MTDKPPVMVYGDSITNLGKEELAALRPTWGIDGVAGRQLPALEGLLDDFRATWGHLPRRCVIALGTNEGGATWQRYKDAVDRFPDHCEIVFVSVYRDPAIWGQDRADAMSQITSWMKGIASNRPKTVVAGWRTTAMNSPDLLKDGVHPNLEGQGRWAQIVSDAMDAANAEPLPA